MKKAPLVLILLLLCSRAFAEQVDIDELVSQLGARAFQVREDAAEALSNIGMPAREALEKAANSSDPELKIRAKRILTEILSGIPSEWPEALRLQLRELDKLSASKRRDLMRSLSADYKEEALPFLFAQLGKDDAAVRAIASECISNMSDKDRIHEVVLARIDAPVNEHELGLLVTAAIWSARPVDLIRVLKVEDLDSGSRKRLLVAARKIVRARIDAGKLNDAEKQSKEFINAAGDDALLLYSRAIALARLGSKDESRKLMGKALLMSKDEAARYSAGELLLELGYLRQSEKEWLEILEMSPEDGVYDLNAYMRLGSIYAKAKMYTRAAEMLEKGSAKYKAAKEKAGSGMGMIGGDVLEGRVEEYRRRANDDEPGEVPETLEEAVLSISLKAVLKEGDAEELAKDERDTAAQLSINVQPHGLRIFEKTNATLAYDREAGELAVLLNNAPCTKKEAFVMKEKSARVVVRDLDMVYIFLIERDTGVVRRLKSYEFDYKATFVPAERVLKWKDVSFKLNDKNYSWEELAEGVNFDYLPKKFDFSLEGVAPSGKKMEIRQTLDPRTIIAPE